MNYKHLTLVLLIIVLFITNLFYGSVDIPAHAVWEILTGREAERESWNYIIMQSRLPNAITALLCGGSLAVSGLMLQTAFNNPLAGPSILGISSGANLGVAAVMLWSGGSIAVYGSSLPHFMSVLIGAFAGSILVMAVILILSTFIRSNLMLLITGIMIGYITSSAISLLNFFSTAEGVHSYVMWGMGNFSGVSMQQMPMFATVCLIGLTLSILLIKPLNALLMGIQYAENLGVNIRLTRNLLLTATGLLTAVTTAFCGPIAFFGLAVPHVARLILGTNNHNTLLPTTILCGGVMALLCNLICTLPGEGGLIPLNAVASLLGAPIIIYVILRMRRGNI